MSRAVGRYVLHDEIAAGGMATVHIGRLLGPVGFSRTVAIKRLHAQYAKDPEFVSMFLDEARLAARIRHPNVVSTLDVVARDGELFLVMDYVQGEVLSRLVRSLREKDQMIPPAMVLAIMAGALQGLHAAHEAKTERGEPLNIVHRDVSPQNILVGVDGIARVLNFGVAKAVGRAQTTRDGQVKGKTSYMAPEQLQGKGVDRRTDLYSAAVVLWETLTARKLFWADSPSEIMAKVLSAPVDPPSAHAQGIPPALDEIALRGLSRNPETRFQSALEMAIALENVLPTPTTRRIGEWVASVAGDSLTQRAGRVTEIESDPKNAALAIHLEHDGASHDDAVHDIVHDTVDEIDQAVPAPAPANLAPPRLPSEHSSIAVATPSQARSSKSVPLVVAIVAIVLLGSAFAIYRFGGFGSSETAPATSSTGKAKVAASETVSAPAATPSPPPAAIESTIPSVTASAKPSLVALPSPIKPPVFVKPSLTAKPDKEPAKPKPNCSPPYTVDSDGVHIPKPECM